MKYYQTKQFRELEGAWEGKLKESGFEDIEKRVGSKKVMKNHNDHASHYHKRLEEKAEYYRILNECFLREIFVDHKIMRDFVAGRKRAEIFRELLAMGHSIEYETVRFIVRRYEYRWGIKHYTPKEMNLKRPPIRL